MTQASPAPESAKKQPGLFQRLFGLTIEFLPWIAYWTLVGTVPFRFAVVSACAISVVQIAVVLLRRTTPKVIEVGSLIVFLIVLLLMLLVNHDVLERWLQAITNGGLLLIGLASLLLGKPFTLYYPHESPAEGEIPEGEQGLNRLITWVWLSVFALMTVSSLIPPIADPAQASALDEALLPTLFFWIIPFVALSLAELFTELFPLWQQRRQRQSHPPQVQPEPELPTDH